MTTPTPFDDSARDDLFNDDFERLLAGDMSGLDSIDLELRDTVLEMTNLARIAGWLDATATGERLTPSGAVPVRDGEAWTWQGNLATLPGLNVHVPSRTANRATGPREVTMRVTAIPTTPPISHRTREHRKPAITRHAPRFPLSGIANAAMVVLVILAGFGAWRVMDSGRGSGGAPSGGHYTLAPMTPVPDATALTGNSGAACDFSDEVPVYNGVDEPPVDGTAIYVTTSHDLMIRCDEEPEDVLLAQDVDSANPAGWPGIITLAIGAGDYSPIPMLLNLQTSKSIEFTFTHPTMTQVRDMGFTGQSPFIATALVDEPSTWTLTDQRTMESRTLSELGEVEWPRNTPIYIADNGPQGTYAIAVHDSFASANHQPALTQPEGFPGEILLVSGSLDNASWIDIPDDIMESTALVISPDGEHVAVLGKDRPETSERSVISILRTSDGTEVARTEPFVYNGMPHIIWVNDSSAVIYHESGALMLLDTRQGSTPESMLESSGRLFTLRKTYHPDIFAISESSVPAEEWRGEADRAYAVNTRTGEVDTYEGVVWQPASTTGTAREMQPVIVTIDPEGSSTRVLDPSTGTTLIDIPMTPTGDQSDWAQEEWQPADTLALSNDGGTAAFTIQDQRTLIVANVSGDQPDARQIDFPEFTPPQGDWSTQVRLSPNGSTVQLSIYTNRVNLQWVLDLSESDATWEEIPQGTWMEFMPSVP